MQLVELDGELADGVGDDGEGQRGDVGVEEAVEAAADAIVVERGELVGGQAEQLGGVPRGPLADAVEGLAGDQEVLEQEQQSGGGGDAAAAILARQVVAEERLEAEPLEEAVEDRQGADGGGVEGPAGGAGDPAGPERGRILRAGACGFLIHEGLPRCYLASMAGAGGRPACPSP